MENFPHMVPVMKRIIDFIPKMHIANHASSCQARFSFNYTPGAGRTFGEVGEQVWAESNQEGGSTKEQNDGHRHDSLDDFHGYWNWQKVVKMST
jgi:hypothetical protein